ncbi:MAG TPA: sigma 54 modulation/S30EA ribosomal C-terminal domain-containing protein [Pseudonocardia sp.]|uniref:sigma 54 modulation/S30EA ribosomal C-terminal domain-containing protein n=1 Tax=Pseudonocardia sp. TaxID=60912 RepID=UPI002B4B3F98|nr:sigma 54 modulation/S30EA ribosomal C-terminal domain-containing protein [Pseudonocardia sp.]HLU55932.1 sigma 54 modulation/S30EA ribosomal C-terminal domain-containing protein [Pseudonocardia sp.]
MHQTHLETAPIEVQLTGRHGQGIAEYARDRIGSVLRFARGPVLHARVRITRHADPAVELPVTAQANLDVNGRLVRAQVRGRTDREAVDLLKDRLRRRLQHHLRRTVGHWEDRRGRGAPPAGGRPAGGVREWRHGDQPTRRPPYFPRPPEEREIVRRKSYTLGECTLDEAAFDMESMDYDFHLFTELGTGQDSVLYRDRDGYRLAQPRPQPEALARHAVPVTVSETPAPELSTEEAVQRMAALDQPFLFYVDRDRGRGALLYHRYDGHYGLITPE